MKKLIDRKAVRVTALILLVVFLIVGSLASGMMRYGIRDRWYRPDTDGFEDTSGCKSYVWDALWYVNSHIGVLPWEEMGTLGSYAGNAFSYVIRDGNSILIDTRTATSEFIESIGAADAASGKSYTVEGYVNLPVGPYDGCYREYLIFDMLFAFRFWIAGAALLMLLLAAGMLGVAVLSVVRAGKRGEQKLIQRLPMDVIFAGTSVLFVFLFFAMQHAYYLVVDYYTNSTGYVLDASVTSGLGVFCWCGWLSVLVYVAAAQLSAKTMQERMLVTILSRKLLPGWWIFGAVGINVLLIVAYFFFNQANVVLFVLAFADLIFLLIVIRFLHEGSIVRKAAEELVHGNLTHKLDTKRLHSIWWTLGRSLNQIGDGMSAAVEERMKSERMKTELITNVSHDLKTPLTSIINYVQLLNDDSLAPAVKKEYLKILDRQSAKLKKLTEDVVEASKAASGVLTVNAEKLNAGELLEQSVGEFEARMRAAGLEPVVQLSDTPVYLSADSALLGRILENLLTNIVKYAQQGTRVYFDLLSKGDFVVLSAKNISREPLNISADELMERFVRGDSSRHSEGSGLGLSIARSLTELMGGTLDIILDGDLFKAEIRFPQIRE